MTAFCPHQDRLHELAARRPGAQLRRVIDRILASLASRDDWSLEPAAPANRALDSHAARFPQRPLILSDKWDF
jgi:hypothetical protein